MAPYSRRAAQPGVTSPPAQTTSGQTPPDAAQPSPPTAAGPGTPSHPPLNATGSATNRANPTAAEIRDAGVVTVSAPLVNAEITKLGGRFLSYQLKNYKASLAGDTQLDLVVVQEGGAYPVGVYSGNLNDAHVVYTLESAEGAAGQEQFTLGAGETLTMRLSGNLTDAVKITKTFSFNADSYLFKISVSLSSPVTNAVSLEWNQFNATLDDDPRINHNYYALLGADDKVKLVQLTEIEEKPSQTGSQKWVSLGDKYFMSAIIPASSPAPVVLGKDGQHFFARVGGGFQGAEFNIFAGPKSHEVLQSAGFNLERNVDLGIFAFVAHPLLAVVKFFYSLLGNYGLAIILLTLVIKLLFLPLTKKSFESMKAMQMLQPEIKALRERVQDPTKMNQEMMALYKKHNVNPMGGCLPMLIQLPVFLGLYNALNNAIELRHAPFALWINDLSSVERLDVMGIGVPVMVLLMGASMFIQQWTTPSSADPQQKKIMMMMPVIITISFVIFPFPSGLVLYWLVNNLISIVQQVYLAEHKKEDVYKATIFGSVVIFLFGYLLTLL